MMAGVSSLISSSSSPAVSAMSSRLRAAWGSNALTLTLGGSTSALLTRCTAGLKAFHL